MKEVKAARQEFFKAKEQIENQASFYNDRFMFGEEGEMNTEKKEVVFPRETLYEEIWKLSPSKVAKKYSIPYDKLKKACEKANIPLPTQSYWGNLYIGKPVEKTPLPASVQTDVTITFSVRSGPPPTPIISPAQVNAYIESKTAAKSSKKDTFVKNTATKKSPQSLDGRNIYERETLYNEVWKKPVTKVAEDYGVSDVMIHKVCKALDVPVPLRGYWAKKDAGQPVEITPLPEHIGATTMLGRKVPTASEDSQETSQDNDFLGFLGEEERFRVVRTALLLRVDPAKRKLHPVLEKHKTSCTEWAKKQAAAESDDRWRGPYNRRPVDTPPPLYGHVFNETWPRLYHILDALYTAIEELGGSINTDLSVQIRGEHVTFSVSEGQEQVKHALTKEEQKQLEKYEREKKIYKYASEPKFRKYDYIPTGRLTFYAQSNSYFRDSSNTGIEKRVGELLLSMYIQSEVVRIEREKKEAAQRKAEEEQRQRELRRQRYNEEIDRLNALNNAAADYEIACKIRKYISAVEAQDDLSPERLEWIAWAKAKADWYDPTISAKDPIFGIRNHNEPRELKKNPWW